MPFKLLSRVKLKRSDQERAGAGDPEEDSPEMRAASVAAFPDCKSMVTQSSCGGSREYSFCTARSRLARSRLLARANVQIDELDEGSVGLGLALAFWSPRMSRLRSEIKSALSDDVRRMLPVVGAGFLKLEFFSSSAAATAFSCAATPRAARLKDSELRKSGPRALLRSSSREITGPTAAASESAIKAKNLHQHLRIIQNSLLLATTKCFQDWVSLSKPFCAAFESVIHLNKTTLNLRFCSIISEKSFP